MAEKGTGSKGKSLVYRFIADTRDFEAGVDRVVNKLHTLDKNTNKTTSKMKNSFFSFGNTVKDTTNKVSSNMKNMQNNSNKVCSSLSTMFGGVAYRLQGFRRLIQALPVALKAISVAAVSVGYAFNRMWKHGMSAESSILTMTTLLGSQEQALENYRHALRFAGRTPFDPSEVGAAAGRATQYGITKPFDKAFKGVKKNLSAMDIFSALGSFTDMEGRFIGLGRAMQAVLTGNLKMARHFRGVIGSAWDETKKIARVGTREWGTELLKRIAQVPKVMELANKRADSMAGAWSTIKGYVAEFWIAMSGVSRAGVWTFWNELRSILLDVRDGLRVFLDESNNFIEVLGFGIGSAFSGIWEILKGIWSVIGPLVKFVWHFWTSVLSIVIKGVIALSKIIWTIIKGVGNIILKITGTSKAFTYLIDKTNLLIQRTQDALTFIEAETLFYIKAINSWFDSASTQVDLFFSYLRKKFNEFIQWWIKFSLKLKINLGFLFPKSEVDVAKKQLRALQLGIKDTKDLSLIDKYKLSSEQAIDISKMDKKSRKKALRESFSDPEVVKRYYESLSTEDKERLKTTGANIVQRYESIKKTETVNKTTQSSKSSIFNQTFQYLMPSVINEAEDKIKMYNATGIPK